MTLYWQRFGLLLIACIAALSASTQGTPNQWLDVNYAGDGQVYHNLDIHLPAGKPPFKTIVVIYGSAWFANNMKQMGFQAIGKPLLDSGFAVVAINHRSSADSVYPAQLHDVKAAIRFVKAAATQYKLDTSFIGITGFSSGGHLASLAGATNGLRRFTVGSQTVDLEGTVGSHAATSSSVHAVVDWFGPIDMSRMKNCTDYNNDKSPEAALIRGNPADNADRLALLNPMTFLDAGDPKFLVIHGQADNVVPDCQSRFFADSLRAKGLLTQFVSVPNGGHGPQTFNAETFRQMAAFFVAEANRRSRRR